MKWKNIGLSKLPYLPGYMVCKILCTICGSTELPANVGAYAGVKPQIVQSIALLCSLRVLGCY
jgi:hypothetical protein